MLCWVGPHLCAHITPVPSQLGYSKRVGWRSGRHTPLSVPGALFTPLAPDPIVAIVGPDPHSRLVRGGGLQRWQRHDMCVLKGFCLALLWVQGYQQAC